MLPSTLRLTEPTVQSMLRAIRAPVLVIAADPAPPYFSADVRAQRLACVADARLHVVPGGHHLHMEQPERIAPLLLDFLSG
jgi:pimeloyl-ACP methyl ester carboxylesterase